MTDQPSLEQQLADAKAEIQRLRDHNTAILGEKKAAKLDLAALREEHATNVATLQRLQLDNPTDELIAEISTDPKLFRALFGEKYQFALDEEGRPAVRTLEGQPVMVRDADGKQVPLAFDARAVSDFLCPRSKRPEPGSDAERWARILIGSRASGGGATGMTTGADGRQVPPAEPNEKKRTEFGLR